jgi:hypothetical protein
MVSKKVHLWRCASTSLLQRTCGGRAFYEAIALVTFCEIISFGLLRSPLLSGIPPNLEMLNPGR